MARVYEEVLGSFFFFCQPAPTALLQRDSRAQSRSKLRFVWTERDFSPVCTIRFSSHRCRRPQETRARGMNLQHRRIDLQQQGAPLDASIGGAVDSTSAVGLSDRWGCVEITQVKIEELESTSSTACGQPRSRSVRGSTTRRDGGIHGHDALYLYSYLDHPCLSEPEPGPSRLQQSVHNVDLGAREDPDLLISPSLLDQNQAYRVIRAFVKSS